MRGQQITCAGRQVLDHAACQQQRLVSQQGAQALQLVLQQAQALGNTQQYLLIVPGGRLGTVEKLHGSAAQPVSCKVALQRPPAHPGVTPAVHCLACSCQCAGQGAKAVVDHQQWLVALWLLLHALQQIQVGSIKGLKCGIAGGGVALQLQRAVGRGAGEHGGPGR